MELNFLRIWQKYLILHIKKFSDLSYDDLHQSVSPCCHASSAFTRLIVPLSRHSTNLRTSWIKLFACILNQLLPSYFYREGFLIASYGCHGIE